MANVRQQEQDLTRAAMEPTRKMYDDTSRAARTAFDAGSDAALAGTQTFQRNAQTAHQAWKSGNKMAGKLIDQSMQLFTRAFGIAGDGAQQVARSSRNMEAVMKTGSIVAEGMQNISSELLDLARQRSEQNLQRAESLMRCRTPQDFTAECSDFVREDLEAFVKSTHRIGEISVKMTDEAARHMKDVNVPR